MVAPVTDRPAIRTKGVSKRFGATVALAGVSVEIEESTVFGLLGPNGAGKTTLVRVLTTLLRPDARRLACSVGSQQSRQDDARPRSDNAPEAGRGPGRDLRAGRRARRGCR